MHPKYKSDVNREVAPARPDEFRPLPLGSMSSGRPWCWRRWLESPTIRFASSARAAASGLYVSEMITARPLVEGNEKTLRIADFGPDESPRSLQLYGVDPHYVGRAVERLVGEGRVDHIDMNFGCPVRKVTRKGGGSALPLKRALLRSIVRAAVRAAEPAKVPITIKFRLSVSDELLTFLDAGKIGEDEGCAYVALHARTAAPALRRAGRLEPNRRYPSSASPFRSSATATFGRPRTHYL